MRLEYLPVIMMNPGMAGFAAGVTTVKIAERIYETVSSRVTQFPKNIVRYAESDLSRRINQVQRDIQE